MEEESFIIIPWCIVARPTKCYFEVPLELKLILYFSVNLLDSTKRKTQLATVILTNYSPALSVTKMAATATIVTNTPDSRSRRTLNQRLEDTTMKKA